MHIICQAEPDSGHYLDLLTCSEASKVLVTKLITEKGKMIGSGDMLELVKILNADTLPKAWGACKFTQTGSIHIGMECDNIKQVVSDLSVAGGQILIEPFKRENNNWLSFALDLEGNCLELIERSGRETE